ncbi:MAG TPA: helix-turn-helix domain-containing protein [Trebonia sp.]|nr:helix-turn-helix domain-containing protein [Trebonia sp.]
MSVEAISWALNLAPAPRDRGGKRNPACKTVLVGLAKHAGPDGTEAFPSGRTLVRYTDLSERTVRTALDRLEADGIIRPCDPAIVAAKIKRADQRPQGWDLAMHLVRDALDGEDLAVLERQFPGLTARVTLAATGIRAQSGDDAGSGMQQVHPAAGTPGDNGADGVQRLHLVPGTGCNERSYGVQLRQERGAAVAPEPSLEPPTEPPAANAGTRGVRPVSAGHRLRPDGRGEGILRPPWAGLANDQPPAAPACPCRGRRAHSRLGPGCPGHLRGC